MKGRFNFMDVCKQCGIIYNTGYPLCPDCTDQYNAAYGRVSISKIKPRKSIDTTQNTIKMVILSLLSSVALIISIGLLQAYVPLIWSFYYAFVGSVFGRVINKHGFKTPVSAIIFGFIMILVTYYLADVFTIGLVNQIDWSKMNEYQPSIWLVTYSWATQVPESLITILFKAIGLYTYWQQSRQIL